MSKITSERKQQIRQRAEDLKSLEGSVRLLRAITWPDSVKAEFFEKGGRELPRVIYEPMDMSAVIDGLLGFKNDLSDDPVDQWFFRQADAIETGAHMLASLGTADFFHWSSKVYGRPTDPSIDGRSTVLDLARHLDETLSDLQGVHIGAPPKACHLAFGVAETIRTAVDERFGEDAPEVEIVDGLASNAIAGPRRIRLRRDACFTDLDAEQLLHHEAYIHVATALNGRYQEDLPILSAGHPGTTRTQEGLAVFAELISGSWDIDRLRRLARRVITIQMAVDGADFLDIYRYFLDQGVEPEQAFENARRVFRGGPITGGAPFTKDAVYLDGLLQVHSYLAHHQLVWNRVSESSSFCPCKTPNSMKPSSDWSPHGKSSTSS